MRSNAPAPIASVASTSPATSPPRCARSSPIVRSMCCTAVLAGTAVQHIERTIGLERAQRGGDVAGDVDANDAIGAGAFERIGAGHAGAQGNRALGRPAAHQDCNVFHGFPSLRMILSENRCPLFG